MTCNIYRGTHSERVAKSECVPCTTEFCPNVSPKNGDIINSYECQFSSMLHVKYCDLLLVCDIPNITKVQVIIANFLSLLQELLIKPPPTQPMSVDIYLSDDNINFSDF